jgi:hypothetical protein
MSSLILLEILKWLGMCERKAAENEETVTSFEMLPCIRNREEMNTTDPFGKRQDINNKIGAGLNHLLKQYPWIHFFFSKHEIYSILFSSSFSS